MRVLVAVDGSEASRKAIGFARSLVGNRTDVELTVFHVTDVLPEFIASRSGASPSGEAYVRIAQDWADSHREEGQKLLSAYRDELIQSGVPATSVRTALLERESRPEARRVSASIGIIEEMKTGRYDVVIVGRRGTSESNESLIGSVAERVAREAAGRTVCIVD